MSFAVHDMNVRALFIERHQKLFSIEFQIDVKEIQPSVLFFEIILSVKIIA